ncbi:MAG: class I SAM-dependent RNA methyltransferase [Granulosicoccus sp.]|nr:class I SAM-dependent RNA methyltransferase [Granulosicoccus sp.]
MIKDKTGWNKHRRKRRDVEPQETELVIESLTNAGDGLGRQDNRVVFVPYTIPGDKVRVRITERKKTYALATVIECIEPGPERIAAPCPYFGRCGGCDWQHVPYSMQLAAKEEQLRDTLTRIGLLKDLPIEAIIASPHEYGYRNRIQGEIHSGKFHYKWRRSDQRIAVQHCAIAEEAINDFLRTDLTHTPPGRVEIALIEDRIRVSSVDDRNSTEHGFRQVNTAVSRMLTERLLQTIESSQCSHIIDLYCGRGHWTNQLAQRHPEKRITGVDASDDNIDAARDQARSMNLGNVIFHQSAVEKTLRKLGLQDSVCIVDPPRAGLDGTVTDRLISEPCRHLLYVSCHPATLARDLKRLTEHSYTITTLVPMDMFPQTAHLECLVHLQRRQSGPME